MVIGSISTTEDNIDPISLVSTIYKKLAHIMMKKLAAKLPEHTLDNHAIDITDSEKPPWGPSYAPSEKEL
jgi:hypothetical protein